MGWAWPEWVGSRKLGFSDGLGQVLTIQVLKHVPPTLDGSMKFGFSDGLGQVLTIQALKHVPPTPEHKSHTGVKILSLDLYGI